LECGHELFFPKRKACPNPVSKASRVQLPHLHSTILQCFNNYDLTELAPDANPPMPTLAPALTPKLKLKLNSPSLCEGITLLFIVFLLSTLAHREDTDSASGSTLLSVTPAALVHHVGVTCACVWCVVVWWCWVHWAGGNFGEVVAGESGVIRSSTGTFISVMPYILACWINKKERKERKRGAWTHLCWSL
jgi:hypothetical protein